MTIEATRRMHPMKKIISLTLIICQFIVLSNICFSQQDDKEMRVIKTKNNYLVANKGSIQNVTINSIYDIISVTAKEKKIVGQAKVVLVRNNFSGLKILELAAGYIVQPGFMLSKNLHIYSEEDNILNEMENIDISEMKRKQQIEQYYQQQYTRNIISDKYKTNIAIGRWGLFFSWVATAAGSGAMGDEMFGSTVIPVIGPFVTIYRIENKSNHSYINGGPGLLITAGVVQSFFAAYYVHYLIKDSKHNSTLSIQPSIQSLGLRLTYNF